MKRIRKILTVLLISGIVGAAVYFSFAPRPVLVETVAVSRGPLQATIVEEGKTRVVDRYGVSAPVAGTLSRMSFDVGDEVRAGTVLARLHPLRSATLDGRSRAQAGADLAVAEAALAKAEDDVETARADVRYWEVELPRARRGVEGRRHRRRTSGPRIGRRTQVPGSPERGRATDRSGAIESRGRKSGFAVFGRPGVERVSRDRNGALSRERPYPQGPSGKRSGRAGFAIVAGARRPRRP